MRLSETSVYHYEDCLIGRKVFRQGLFHSMRLWGTTLLQSQHNRTHFKPAFAASQAKSPAPRSKSEDPTVCKVKNEVMEDCLQASTRPGTTRQWPQQSEHYAPASVQQINQVVDNRIGTLLTTTNMTTAYPEGLKMTCQHFRLSCTTMCSRVKIEHSISEIESVGDVVFRGWWRDTDVVVQCNCFRRVLGIAFFQRTGSFRG